MHMYLQTINHWPNKKIYDWIKLKAFADNKTHFPQKLKFDYGWVENIVGKGENAIAIVVYL